MEDLMDSAAAPRDPVHDPVEALVERWWNDHFPGSVLAHHTEAWNHVFAAKQKLIALLRAADARG
jgi:hypothetical protein